MVAEIFRELGYEGATMSLITARTRVSKGSLYHFFPGGKEEMAGEILAHIDEWFAINVYEPLEREAAAAAVARMWGAVDEYFRSGRRICLVGAFALDETRDRFGSVIRGYFRRWIDALEGALVRSGVDAATARRLAEEAVVGIQGGLTVARALKDKTIFSRTLGRLRQRIDAAIAGA